MTIEELVQKSKEICKSQNDCLKCPLKDMACIDHYGRVNGNSEELIALWHYLEKQTDKKASPKVKGRKK